MPLSDSNLLLFLINFICSFSGLKKALTQSEGVLHRLHRVPWFCLKLIQSFSLVSYLGATHLSPRK